MLAADVLHGRGHRNVRALHRTTLAFTTDPEVTPRGDCFIAVGMDRALPDLDPQVKNALLSGARMTITIEAGGVAETVQATGCPGLSFDDPSDLVIRRSGYVCARTLAVGADKAACDLSRGLIDQLRTGCPVRVVLECPPAERG